MSHYETAAFFARASALDLLLACFSARRQRANTQRVCSARALCIAAGTRCTGSACPTQYRP